MPRDISRPHTPPLLPLAVETIEYTRGDIVSGVGNIDILCLGMYHDAIGLLDLLVGPVGDNFAVENLSGAGIYDRVGNIPAIGDITKLGTIDVQ